MCSRPTFLMSRLPWAAVLIAAGICACSRSVLSGPPDVQSTEARSPSPTIGGTGVAGSSSGDGAPPLVQDCAATQYRGTTSAGEPQCMDLSACGGDEYEEAPPTLTTDRVCVPVTRCTSSQYERAPPTATRDRTCASLTVCAAGQYESLPATPTTDRTCADLTECTAGQYVERQATQRTDRACAACPPGSFSNQINAPACSLWTACPGNVWAIDGTSTTDRLCECLAGTAGVVQGDVRVASQAEVDALAGVREITGDLRIAGVTNRFPQESMIADTHSILALACLETVGGVLWVQDHRTLAGLAGLENLTSVESLIIVDNQALLSLDGLDSLASANSVHVGDNDALTSLEALGGLTVTRNHVHIENNDALTDLVGLHNIASVGRLMITNNQSLTSLSALANLTVVRGSLEISSTNLTSLTGLEGVTSVGAMLVVFANAQLTSLTGLGNITQVGRGVRIGYNPLLPSLDGLEGLTSIGEEVTSSENGLSIYGNSVLTDITGLDNLETLVGKLFVYGNAELSACLAEDLATRLGTTCTSTIEPWSCTGVCICGGNLNDVSCAM